MISKDTDWWIFALSTFLGSDRPLEDAYVVVPSIFLALSLGRIAWRHSRNRKGRVPIHSPTASSPPPKSIMGSVFRKRSHDAEELKDLRLMVHEGFELLGAFNWSNYVHDPFRIDKRCARLVLSEGNSNFDADKADSVDVLLSLDGDEKLDEDDMVAVLWEMIFRGTDMTALLTERIMAELVLHPRVQETLRTELANAAAAASRSGGGDLTDADMSKPTYDTGTPSLLVLLHIVGYWRKRVLVCVK